MAQSTAHRRLLQEYRALTNNPPEGITAGPLSEDDLLRWEALVQGPEGTPFEGGVFPAELRFPKDYPHAPPSMRFLSDMWHPNSESPLVFSSPLKGPPSYKNGHKKSEAPLTTTSLSLRPRLHLHPPPPRRRPQPLRARHRALVPHPVRREDPHQRHEHALRAQRREPRKRRGRQDVEGEEGGIRGEGEGRREEGAGALNVGEIFPQGEVCERYCVGYSGLEKRLVIRGWHGSLPGSTPWRHPHSRIWIRFIA